MQPKRVPAATILSGLCLALAGALPAATIETSLVNEESDIINTGGTLISAVHFQSPAAGDPSPLVVNGIPHTVGSGSDPKLTDNFTFEGDFRNGETGFVQDGSNIIQVLYSGIAGAPTITMSVSGLTVGKEYLFQAYWETNNLGAVLEATIEGDTRSDLVALADKFTNPGGTVISYQFVAGDDTLNASFNRTDTATNDWLSGYSLQQVPEPSAALLGALGGFLLIRRRRN